MKSKVQLKILVLSFCCACCSVVRCASNAYGQEINILYTGQTHAMIYPCACPKEPDGGIARRATLLKELKKNNAHTLLLDSGDFFAGGQTDDYTQNTELDKARTKVNLKAMELMQYDAVTIGDDEFNFGKEFLEENINNAKLNFVSCNLEINKVAPYIIKEFDGTKIGIIGVTSLSAMQKAGGLKIIEPKLAVKQAVEKLKAQNVNIIILLSHLDENEGIDFIQEVLGIDILVVGRSREKEAFSKIGSTLILRPSWQGRRLGKLSLRVEDNKIIDYKVDQLRLSDKVKDDPEILSVLPACFSDAHCKKEGMRARCEAGGGLNSRCVFSEVMKIPLLVITPKDCVVCNTERVINFLKTGFPGLTTSYLYYPDAKSKKLISDLDIKALPVYLLDKVIEKEKEFAQLKQNLEIKGNFYILKPQFAGLAYFVERKKIKGKLDLFISLYDKYTPQILDTLKEFNPALHFLTVERSDKFEAAKGNLEVEENLRSVCIQKYYPQKFWDYMSCRTKSINSSWWEDCLADSDIGKIRDCAKSQEGRQLLKDNISLNKELSIMFGPTYLLDNQQIFSSSGVPSKEEFKQLLNKND